MIPKFRAWDKKTKEMLEVESIDFVNETLFLRRESEFSMSWVELNFKDIELMQSIGLKDKNGKEIYEGDVVKGKSDSFRLSCYGEVYWDEEFCRYRINDKKRNRQYDVDWRWKLEIIGNIHEHPELLEENDE